MNNLRPLAAALAVTVLAGACATQKVRVPEPLDLPTEERAVVPDASRRDAAAGQPTRPTSLQRVDTPRVPGSDASVLVAGAAGTPMPPLKGGAVNVNIEGMPVPAFINEFFGSILGVGFQMDPQVARMSDLVTLRTSGPQSPANFYRLAVEVLRTYGVATDYSSGLVSFRRAADGAGTVPPLVVSGRALPDVPISHRPVFQLVELQAVRTQDVISLLNVAFKSDALSIQPDNSRNAVVLMGKPELVRQALDAIRILDRPFMRGRSSARLEPAFVTADELGKRLVDVLQAEGYGATLNSAGGSGSALLVLPIAGSNTVLVFAADRALLEHAVDWARTIDRPNPAAGGNGLFYYTVRNTLAKDIVQTLNGVRAQSSVTTPRRDALDNSGFASNAQAQLPPVATPVQVTNPPPAAGAALAPETALVSGNLGGGRLSLDEPRNAIIFQGEAADWARLLPLVQQMDRAPRQVMIEVTVAEVTLTRDDQFGVAWLGTGDVGKYRGRFGSGSLVTGGLGTGNGLKYLFDIGGQTRISLTALASHDRINVLSTPRLMVKSGEEASIDIGTEVPTISAQATSGIITDGNSGLIQTVQYRKTGIMLTIKPVIYSDDRVDLELRQEVSEALPVGANSTLQTPAIFNRSLGTMLSLKDGRSVLIGGLISQRDNQGTSGVPYLKDVPVLGNLFKTRTQGGNKTEMVLLITPYIVESDVEVDNLTRSLGQRFELLDLPISAPAGPPIQPSTPVDTLPPPRR